MKKKKKRSASIPDAYEPRDYLKSVCYKTVDTFAGITKKTLWLRQGPSPSTDGRQITIPIGHEYTYRFLEHELSHILFKSNAIARNIFATEYASKIHQTLKDNIHPTLFNTNHDSFFPSKTTIKNVICYLINLLEDYRCDYLWGQIYPGSYALKKEMDLCYIKPLVRMAHTSGLMTYFLCIAARATIPKGTNDRFYPYFKLALQKVEGRDFSAVLVVTKWLITVLVEEIIREENKLPPTTEEEIGKHSINRNVVIRSEAMNELIRRIAVAKIDLADDVKIPQYIDYKTKQLANELAVSALNAVVTINDKMDKYLESSEKDMQHIIAEVRQTLKKALDEDTRLQKDAMARLVFVDVSPGDIPTKPPPLEFADLETIKRLRNIFNRISGKKKTTLEYAGTEINPAAYLESKLTGVPVPCFYHEEQGRGFKALILLDRSSSMEGTKTYQAEKACRIISRALVYPFVDLHIWGFQSLENGQADIIRFSPQLEYYNCPKSCIAGVTPLHIAIRVGTRFLETGSQFKQLFVISDGTPYYATRDWKFLSGPQIQTFVRNEVQRAKKRGINIMSVMISPDLPASRLQFMFGSPAHWKVVSTDTFEKDLVQLVSSSFINYLKIG